MGAGRGVRRAPARAARPPSSRRPGPRSPRAGAAPHRPVLGAVDRGPAGRRSARRRAGPPARRGGRTTTASPPAGSTGSTPGWGAGARHGRPTSPQWAEQFAGYGITGVTDATHAIGPERLRSLRASVVDGSLPQRIVLLGADDEASVQGWATLGPAKLLADEALGLDPEVLADQVAAFHRLGRPVAIHAVTRAECVVAVAASTAAGRCPATDSSTVRCCPPTSMRTARRRDHRGGAAVVRRRTGRPPPRGGGGRRPAVPPPPRLVAGRRRSGSGWGATPR